MNRSAIPSPTGQQLVLKSGDQGIRGSGDATHHAEDPFVEVFGFLVHVEIDCRIDHTVHAHDLFLLGQHADIILEGIWNPETLTANIRDSLMREPVVLSR